MAHTYTIEDGKATIRKKGTGEVLGQAEEDQLNDYLADLHKNGPEKMAGGGTVGGLTSDQDDQVNKWISQGMSGQAPDPFQVAQAPQDASIGEGDTDNASAPAETPKDNEDTESKIADAHPGVRPDELAQYVKGEEAQSEAWGPDKQAALMNHLTQGYKKPGFILSEGAAGLGDAIMQGVARAGQGNALNTVERNKENQMKTAAEMGEHLDESNMKHLAAKEHLEELSPSTPLGASNLPMLMAAGQMYGMSPEQLQAMAKGNPQTAMKLLEGISQFASQKQKLQIEQEMKMLELQIQQQNAKATQDLTRMGRETEEKRTQQDAAKALAGTWLHPIQAYKARKALEGQLPGSSAGTPHGIPDLGGTFNGEKVISVKKLK